MRARLPRLLRPFGIVALIATVLLLLGHGVRAQSTGQFVPQPVQEFAERGHEGGKRMGTKRESSTDARRGAIGRHAGTRHTTLPETTHDGPRVDTDPR